MLLPRSRLLGWLAVSARIRVAGAMAMIGNRERDRSRRAELWPSHRYAMVASLSHRLLSKAVILKAD